MIARRPVTPDRNRASRQPASPGLQSELREAPMPPDAELRDFPVTDQAIRGTVTEGVSP